MNAHPDQASSRLDRATFYLALLQCILQPISHVTALENITFYPMLACVVVLAWTRRETSAIRTPIVASVLALSVFFIVVSILGPYPLESLNAWRKDFLPPLATFMALLLTLGSRQRTVAVLMAVIAGAAIRLTVIAIEVWILQQPLIGGHPGFVRPYTGSVVPSAFFGGFAIGAAIYAPLIAATLLRKDLPAWGRYMAIYALAGCALVVAGYGSRTPMVAMCAGLAVVAGATLSRRTMLASGLLALAAFAVLYWHKPEAVERYSSIFAAQTYIGGTPGQGTNIGDRLCIWQGIIEVANQRPVTGYGYGWKKLSTVVKDEGFLERWKADPSTAAFSIAYFSRGYGGINPHNLLVHLYFEGGVLGVFLFALMLAALLQGCWQLWRLTGGEGRALAIVAGGFTVAWMVANVGNSIWAGEKLPFVVMALVAATLWRSASFASVPPRRILVIRRDNIGDLVCTTPLLTGLRHRFPDAELCVLANSYNAGVLRGNPDVDATFAYSKLKHRLPGESRLTAVWRRLLLIVQLRRKRFDVAILAKSGFDRHGLRFARLVGIHRIIGFSPPDGLPVAGLTDPLPARSGELRHEVEALADLVAPLGVDVTAHPLTVVADPVLRQRQRDLIAGLSPSATKLVALHVSAREASRKWPAEKVIELIGLLSQEAAWTIVLMWAPGASDDPRHPGDDAFARDILARTHAHPVVPMPTHSLGELIAALSVCHIFIGADGGAMHIAAGVGLPIVGLFENSEFKLKHWHPWRVPCELVHSDTEHDVSAIAPAAVFAAWHRLVSQCA